MKHTSLGAFGRKSPLPMGSSDSCKCANHAGWVKSPVPSSVMPLRRAHQVSVSMLRSRLHAREYFEWMCRSATNEWSETFEGTPHPVTHQRATARYAPCSSMIEMSGGAPKRTG